MNKRICSLFIFFNLLCIQTIVGQCPPSGDVTFNSQSDVDSFVSNYPNCDTIDGNLIIQGSSIVDISGLSSLRVLNGHLKILNTEIVDFTGLSFLREIGGVYTEIRQNPKLTSVNLENLVKIDSYLSINSNVQLLTVTGFYPMTVMKSIEFSHNYSLTSIPLFNNLTKVGTLHVLENESLVSFLGFTNLTCIEDGLSIHGNDVLETMPNFNKLKNVSGFSFRISYNPFLKEITGFENLEYVNNLLLIEANGWENNSQMPIPSFNNLREINGSLYLSSAVSTVNGFNKLQKLPGQITITGTRSNEIVGFNNLKEVGGLTITDHHGYLTSIDAFHNLEAINGDFNLFSNRELETVNGFTKLKRVSWDLQIGSNFKLTNLDFLKSLMSVGTIPAVNRIGIGGNGELTDCNGIASLLEYGEVPNIIDIDNNPTKCSSPAEIIANADRDKDGIINTLDLDDDNDGIYDTLENIGNMDVDGDLLPNSLDLDSDNDGCFDVLEAGLDDSNNDGVVGGTPVTVDTDGLVTSSLLGYLPPNDINTDGVLDFLDFALTPILTAQPESTSVTTGSVAVFSSTINNADIFQWQISYNGGQVWQDLTNTSVFNGSTTSTLTINNATLTLDDTLYRLRYRNSNSPCSNDLLTYTVYLEVINTSSNAGQDTSLSFCPNDSSINLFDAINGNPDPGGYWVPALSSGSNIFDPSQDNAGTYRYYLETNDCTSIFSEIEITIENNNAGIDGNLSICSTSTSVNLFTSLGGNPDAGGMWSPSLSSGTGMFDPSIDAAGTYTYTVSNGVCGSVSSEVVVTIEEEPNAGIDGDLSICSTSTPVDLFTSLGGNPDTGGVWSPSLSSGTGVFNPSTDTAGIYTYTINNGVCNSVSATVEITVESPPNSGSNGSLSICSTSTPVNLFASLGGSPDTGGVWSPSLSSGTGMFDPSLDNAGTYMYTVSSGTCGSVSSEVVVIIEEEPNAGTDGDLSLCSTSIPVDLFTSLGGSPDAGGIWSPSLSSGTGVFDPSTDIAGIYTYTVSNGVCNSVSATVEVTVESPPNSGINGSLSICSTSAPVNLFASLGGSPDIGGVWSPSLSSGTGMFDPSIDNAGTYTYTVTSGTCGSVSSEVTVDVFTTYHISNFEVQTTDFEDNNYVKILINEPGTFEYSLDNQTFQSNNTFTDLLGGDYIVYVRQVNGCGRLIYEFSILDYPKYFTPNNDGINDRWKLKGETNKEYTIYIYNRFGKLIKILKNSNDYWSGTYNGKLMPSSDYWFILKFRDGKIVKGNFSLLRN